MDAFKDSLKLELYNKFVENAAYYAPPYLPLNEFAKKRVAESFTTYSLFQQSEPGVEYEFSIFLKTEYPDYKISKTKGIFNRS